MEAKKSELVMLKLPVPGWFIMNGDIVRTVFEDPEKIDFYIETWALPDQWQEDLAEYQKSMCDEV